MNAKEAKEQSLWNDLHGDIKYYIKRSVELGVLYTKIDKRYMTEEAKHALQTLGYTIFYNSTNDTYEIRW